MCANDPGACEFPDATSTGADATAKLSIPGDVRQGTGWHYDSRGWVEIDGAGAVFEGYRVGVNVNVSANNVTVRNNVIALTGRDWGVSLRHTTGVKIASNTIKGQSFTNPCDNAIRGIYGDDDGVTIKGNNIYNCWSGVNAFAQGGLIEDNYIHDFGTTNATPVPHLNGIQLCCGWPVR